MKQKRPINTRIYTRATVAILLIATWLLSAASGIILWLAPDVHRAGQQLLLFDITKQAWVDIHLWISIAAIIVTLAHIVIDWKALRGILRYTTSTLRNNMPA